MCWVASSPLCWKLVWYNHFKHIWHPWLRSPWDISHSGYHWWPSNGSARTMACRGSWETQQLHLFACWTSFGKSMVPNWLYQYYALPICCRPSWNSTGRRAAAEEHTGDLDSNPASRTLRGWPRKTKSIARCSEETSFWSLLEPYAIESRSLCDVCKRELGSQRKEHQRIYNETVWRTSKYQIWLRGFICSSGECLKDVISSYCNGEVVSLHWWKAFRFQPPKFISPNLGLKYECLFQCLLIAVSQ